MSWTDYSCPWWYHSLTWQLPWRFRSFHIVLYCKSQRCMSIKNKHKLNGEFLFVSHELGLMGKRHCYNISSMPWPKFQILSMTSTKCWRLLIIHGGLTSRKFGITITLCLGFHRISSMIFRALGRFHLAFKTKSLPKGAIHPRISSMVERSPKPL